MFNDIFGCCQFLFIVDLRMRCLVYDAFSRCSFAVADAVVFVFVVGVMWCWVMVLVGGCERVEEMAETFGVARSRGTHGEETTLSAAQGHQSRTGWV